MILENIEFLKKADPEVGDAVMKELVRQQDLSLPKTVYPRR